MDSPHDAGADVRAAGAGPTKLHASADDSADAEAVEPDIERLVETDPTLAPSEPSKLLVSASVLEPQEVAALLEGLSPLLSACSPLARSDGDGGDCGSGGSRGGDCGDDAAGFATHSAVVEGGASGRDVASGRTLFPKDAAMNLTPRQTDVIVAIRNYRHLHGYSPTMQELADQLGTSKVTIFEHVGALEKKRVLRRDKHKARSLEIVSEDKLPDEDRNTKLPLLGNIAAGSPIEAVENREELDLEQMFHAKSGVYVLRVRGDSMIDDHLCDGDYVVIERRENARNGEQVVALLDSGEATLKRFYKEGSNKIRLQPANSSMEPRIVDAGRCRVQGVVIGVLRSYNN